MTTDPLPDPRAIRLVARRVLADQLKRYPPSWEDYPDIGENDWGRVLIHVRHLANRGDVQAEQYDSAYRYLAERSERDA